MLAGGWFQLRTRQVSIHRFDQVIAAHHDDDGTNTRIPIEIIGVISEPIREITTNPQPGDPPTWATPKTQTLVHVEQVYLTDQDQRGTWTNANARLRVLLPDGYMEESAKTQDQEQIKPGDRVQLIGMYRPPSIARNIGEPDWSMLSAQSGRVGTLIIPNQALIEPVAYTDFFARSKGMFIRFRSQLQVRAMRSLGLDSSELSKAVSPQQAMLGALLLGHREPAFGEVYESFKRIGVAHDDRRLRYSDNRRAPTRRTCDSADNSGIGHACDSASASDRAGGGDRGVDDARGEIRSSIRSDDGARVGWGWSFDLEADGCILAWISTQHGDQRIACHACRSTAH